MYNMRLPRGRPILPRDEPLDQWYGQEITLTDAAERGTASYDEFKRYLKTDTLANKKRYSTGISRHQRLFDYDCEVVPDLPSYRNVTASSAYIYLCLPYRLFHSLASS